MNTLTAVSFFCLLACTLAFNSYYEPITYTAAVSRPISYAIRQPTTYVKSYSNPISYVAPAPISTSYVENVAAPLTYSYGSPLTYSLGSYGYPYYYKK